MNVGTFYKDRALFCGKEAHFGSLDLKNIALLYFGRIEFNIEKNVKKTEVVTNNGFV